MGKWLLISVLLFVFSGLLPENDALSTDSFNDHGAFTASVRQGYISGKQVSFRSGLPASPLPLLVPGQLVLPEAGWHQGSPFPLTGSWLFTAAAFHPTLAAGPVLIHRDDQPADHFDHLFPFFHFW